MTDKNLKDKMRTEYTKALAKFLSKEFDTEVCQTAAGTLMIPAVDDEGNGRWVKFSIIIPTDANEEDGNDGYSLAAEYRMKVEARAERKAEQERKAAERLEKTRKNPKKK